MALPNRGEAARRGGGAGQRHADAEHEGGVRTCGARSRATRAAPTARADREEGGADLFKVRDRAVATDLPGIGRESAHVDPREEESRSTTPHPSTRSATAARDPGPSRRSVLRGSAEAETDREEWN